MTAMVELESVSKQFGKFNAVKNISLNVKQGEFLTLLGPSGCGKTTTLRMIAGFEKPTSGRVYIDGKEMNDVEPYHRKVNTVFQNYSLFPHMTIFDNVAFGLKMKKVKKEEIKERVIKVLQLVQLEKFLDRKPEQLSGGQQQRVAIARAIVNNPQVLLLDEPLGALDLKLRKQMQLELKHLQQTLGITFIYVTHDQEEALTMSDRIVIMNEGKIEQIGSARDVYEKPETLFAANFIGETNIVHGTITKVNSTSATLKIGSELINIPNNDDIKVDDKVYISIRPEKITYTTNSEMRDSHLSAKVEEEIYIGLTTKIIARLEDNQRMVIHQSDTHQGKNIKDGTIRMNWKPENCIIYKVND